MSEVVNTLRLRASELKTKSGNEASTRFKLIDDILFGLLSWTKEDIEVEERVREDGETEFCDYLISTGRHSILLEAKKVGASFEGLPKSRKAFLKGSWLSRPVGQPIRQARDYARKKSVGYCIATNGLSWIAFPINRRDQVSFEDSACVVFPDIDTILGEDLEEFKALFSRQAVVAGSLDRALIGSERDQNEPRRLNNIYDKSFSKINRASIFPHIEREIVTAFNEELLTDNADLLNRCYVQTPERTRFDSRLQMYLAPRDQVLRTRPIKPVSRRGGKGVERILHETRLNTRPIALLTLGLVGAGKTTFLNYTSRVTSKQLFSISASQPHAHWIYIDFRGFSASRDPRSFAIDGIFDYIQHHPFLRDNDKHVKFAYAQEIEALRSGPLAMLAGDEAAIRKETAAILMDDYRKKEPYAIKIISHAAKKSPVFLVVDNVDQIDDQQVQAKIFLEGTALARLIRANLVLAMRDATYVKNRSSAVFDAFDFDAVYIEPPNVLAVLSKRFTVAEQLLKGKKIEFASENGARLLMTDAKLVIDLLSQSVLGTEVGRIIEVAATGDTRLALQMTRQFLQYGYTSTAKALELYRKKGRYQLPLHEALRAIMLGNQNVYREDFSVFGNPFDARLGRSDLQLLRLYLMSVLVSYSSQKEFEGLPARELIENLERIGVSEASSEAVIKDLIRFRYAFSRSHQSYTRETIIIPSRLCGYVVRELIARMVFIETVMFDTFIGDDQTWDAIKENMRLIYRERNLVRKIGMRREVASLFFDFLEEHLEPIVAQARARGLAPQWCINVLSRVRDEFKEDMTRAISSARRNYATEGSDPENALPLFQRPNLA